MTTGNLKSTVMMPANAGIAVTVSGNLGKYTKGQVLTDKAAIIDYLRKGALEGAEGYKAKRIEQLSNDFIWSWAIAPIPEEWQGGEDEAADFDMYRVQGIESLKAPDTITVESVMGKTFTSREIVSVDVTPNEFDEYSVTYNDGETTTLPVDGITAIQDAYREMHNFDTKLSISDLCKVYVEMFPTEEALDTVSMSEVIVSVEAMEKDMPAERTKSTGGGRTAQGVAIRDKLAIELGSKIASDKEIVREIEEIVKFSESLKILPASVAWRLDKVLTKDDRSQYPVPGSKEPTPEEKKKLGGNAKWDVRKAGEGSFYGDVVTQLPGYQETIGKPLEYLKMAKNNDAATPKEWRKSTAEIDADIKMYGQRKTNVIKAVKGSIKLLSFMDDIHEKTKLKASFRTYQHEGKEVLTRSTSPMSIALPNLATGVGKEKYFSIGSLLNVDLDKVALAEDQFEAFVAKREKPEEEKVTVHVNNVEQFRGVISDITSCFEDTKFSAEIYKALTGDTSDEFLEDIFNLERFIGRITSRPVYQQRHLKIQEAKATAAGQIESKMRQTLQPTG